MPAALDSDSQPAPAPHASATSAPATPAGGTKPGVAMTECPLCRRSVPMATADRHVDSCMRQHSAVEAAASRKRSAPSHGGHISPCIFRSRTEVLNSTAGLETARITTELVCVLLRASIAQQTSLLSGIDVFGCAQRLRQSGSASSHRRMRLGAANHRQARRRRRRKARRFRRVLRSTGSPSSRTPAVRRRRRHPRRRAKFRRRSLCERELLLQRQAACQRSRRHRPRGRCTRDCSSRSAARREPRTRGSRAP